MAVELLDYNSVETLERDKTMHEAVFAGLESLQTLVQLLSYHSATPKQHKFPSFLQKDCSVVAKATISKFKRAVALLGRPGHARFRRAPAGHRRVPSLAHLSESALLEAPASCSSSEGNGMESCNRGSPSSQEDSLAQEGSRTGVRRHARMHLAHPEVHARMCGEDLLDRTSTAQLNFVSKAIPHTLSFERPSLPISDLNVGPANKPATSACAAELGAVPSSHPSHNCVIPVHDQEPAHATPFTYRDFIIQTMRMGGRLAQAQGEALCNGRSASYSLSCTPPPSTTASSFLSSLSMDGSVTNGNGFMIQQMIGGGGGGGGAGRPPVSKKCSGSKGDEGEGKCHSLGKCHCSKRRKSKNRTVVRVPSASAKAADIPTDEFSWRKYGQKPIKGSPYPRGYYRCSTVRGCPARKHVERAVDDANMLVVTYEGEHKHSTSPNENA